MANIEHFSISGLHHARDVSIAIDSNKIVLVGVNGLGKTTIINIMYYFLTGQWSRLREYEFVSIAARVGGQELRLEKAHLKSRGDSYVLIRHMQREFPEFRRLPQSSIEYLLENPGDALSRRRFSARYSIPYRRLTSALEVVEDRFGQQELFEDPSPIDQLSQKISQLIDGQVLYLPTYRRIERDLQKILPGYDRQMHARSRPGDSDEKAFIEFVEFGMRDVEHTFESVMYRLKERARVEFNNLAAGYLAEVIRGAADKYDQDLISSLDDNAVERILNRVEERNLLNAADRDRLSKVIGKLKSAELAGTTQDKYMAHFFSKLARIHQTLEREESAVKEFVQVCNRYLVDKQLVFEDRSYIISIDSIESERERDPIELSYLSSGEKQIVSLFAHIYLGQASEILMLIDEPELSLSVPWQKLLLPDVWRSGRCTFLAAVTHSPFIYDNEFEGYATDLASCLTSL